MTFTDLSISPLVDAKTWRDAICIVIDQKTNNGECFSSGEVTKEIRTQRPDLHFSHWDVGEYVRDLYFSNSIQYDSEVAEQVSRYTGGSSRTPYGAKVFVYGPTEEEAFEHNFEVEIPKATSKPDAKYQEYGSLANEGPRRSEERFKATVHKDKRLCIPRAPFEEFVHKTGAKLGLGDKVHISLDEAVNKIKVRLDKSDDSKEYDLTRDRGRVKYKPLDFKIDWAVGDSFEVEVTDEGLDVDVSEGIKVADKV